MWTETYADSLAILATATVAMLSGHESWPKTPFICSAIKQKWYESEGLGEVKAEKMSADSGFLVVRISEFDLKEVGKKSSTEAKIPL